ncbi:MAG: hypothetical protein EOP87_09065 [Verrucomicrobiaceae bacterium]|nr:MAG: hypothetical protein EOP87_09065 [Verrucomicrobiaceae bacterium]
MSSRRLRHASFHPSSILSAVNNRITGREQAATPQPTNKMRNYSKLIGALAAVSALAAGNASAIDINYNLHAGYTSEYIFRGINSGSDLVETGFDASTELASGFNLSAGVWAATFDAPTAGGSNDQTEIDLYAKASYDLGFAVASVGYIYYYNDQDDATVGIGRDLFDAQEVSFGLSREFFGLNVGLTYFWDVSTDNDGYSELSISKSFELNSCLTLNVGSALGYLVERGHLSHLTTKVSLDYEFVENARFSPFVALSVDLTGGHFDDVVPSPTTSSAPGTKNELVGGAMISVDF